MLNLAELKSAAVKTDPYPYFYLERSVQPEHIQALIDEFPALDQGGSFNFAEFDTPAKLRQFIEEFDSPEVRRIIEEKFDVDLAGKPMMATLRGYSRAKDGRIHTDSKTKVITVLVYLNENWEPETGRLRILRNGTDMDDYVEELLPGPSSLVAFKVTDNCWHGYPSFEGRRQAIQINFLTGDSARSKHQFFHGISAKLKRLFR
ncbi:2OG-Fe(II) oxygenase [Microbulbifer hainanensis]|uniref:2OG-Fe(II) oxygenase n=1 Tax=Microbulbifer hainanensis TaxID=2735675 RepID=UPI0018689C1D|nr:2OG-Fe(II) oxygenase [Microbulbifer hainanensis]